MRKLKIRKELLPPDKMTKSFMIDNEINLINTLLPFKIKKTDNFQVIGYTLKVREYHLAHLAHKLSAQHYPSIKAVFNDFLSKKRDSFNLCFCPIYFITYTEGELVEGIPIPKYETEKLAYVGKTNSKSSRFQDGHLATQKLNEFIYYDKLKTVYMTQVYIDFQVTVKGNPVKYNNIALEWLEFEEENITQIIIDFIEKYLIFGLRPELNELDNPAFQSGIYIKEPSLLGETYLNPSVFKVVGSNQINQLLYDFDILKEIEKLGHPWNESIEFFQKYGLLPKM
ncbi:hypothetical protein [Bacillus toyonensis]|uniref:hypothetical protein n=1 Tax=Bacillus toyonensis TaxID=155322 RepID=UPI003D212868